MTADDMLELLRERHKEDVFVGECKNGRSWGPEGHLRLDGWAMNRSWSRMCWTGYEIKVSRSDFLGDSKWPGYLPLCNVLYFVAPRGVIKPDELPAEVGLLNPTGNAGRLQTAKKAPHRKIDPPVNLLLYLLMCRSTIDAPKRPKKLEEWRAWLAEKEENRQIGHMCGEALRKRYWHDVEEVRIKMESLTRRAEGAEKIERAARAAGIRLGYDGRVDEHSLKDAMTVLTCERRAALAGARRAIDELLAIPEVRT